MNCGETEQKYEIRQEVELPMARNTHTHAHTHAHTHLYMSPAERFTVFDR